MTLRLRNDDRPVSWAAVASMISMRYPRRAAARQHTHAITDAEFLVGRLGDGNHPSRIQLDGDFHAFLAGYRFFRCRATQAAQHCADRRANDAALAAADRAAGYAADH